MGLSVALTSCTISCSEKKSEAPEYLFEKHSIPRRDNHPEYFKKDLKTTIELLAPGVKIIRDAGLTFYIVQAEDIKEHREVIKIEKEKKVKKGKKMVTKRYFINKVKITKLGDFQKIRNKLIKVPEFSYLSDPEYDRTVSGNKTSSFNIPASSIVTGMYLPIPLKDDDREISVEDFANYCHDAIKEMKENPIYKTAMKELLLHTTEDDLIASMLAFARSESTQEYTTFQENI